jgi:hypothetical protein
MAEGIPEVYEAGKKTAYDEFWDTYQRNGETMDCRYLFAGYGWRKETLLPKYDIKPKKSTNMFAMHNSGLEPYDLAEHLEKLGVSIDFSEATETAERCFYYATVTRLPAINNTSQNFLQTVAYCKAETIDKFIVSNTVSQTFDRVFVGCENLKNILFEGVIRRSISFPDSPLSVASLKSIISCLNDFSGTDKEYTYTITFKSDCWTALDAEGATAPGGVTWRDYVTIKGWKAA